MVAPKKAPARKPTVKKAAPARKAPAKIEPAAEVAESKVAVDESADLVSDPEPVLDVVDRIDPENPDDVPDDEEPDPDHAEIEPTATEAADDTDDGEPDDDEIEVDAGDPEPVPGDGEDDSFEPTFESLSTAGQRDTQVDGEGRRSALALEFKRTISEGNHGPQVDRCMEALAAKGFWEGQRSPVYGTLFAKAVRKFQSAVGLRITGDINVTTWEAILNPDGPTKADIDMRDAKIAHDSAAVQAKIDADRAAEEAKIAAAEAEAAHVRAEEMAAAIEEGTNPPVVEPEKAEAAKPEKVKA